MDVLKRLADSVVVPVVVLEKAEDAIPTANAMLAGGIDTMEITFRTACAADAIKAVAEGCPDMLVGAGTVLNLEQAKLAVSMGAKFIVSPGFSEEVVAWCVENGIAVAPGCVTPSEIMSAKKYGLKMVKFFPANVYGGLTALKNLAAPFGDMKFLPTGGVNEYIKKIVVYAPDKSSGKRKQKVKIFFNFVDDVDIPVISEPIVTQTTYERRKTA